MSSWQTEFPLLHRALAPEYRSLAEFEVEAVVRSAFGEDITLADAEGIFDDVGRALSGAATAAAPVVQRALPGMAAGALSGAALGPWGMLGGAVLGGVGSALGGGAARPSSAGAAAPAPAVPRPPTPAPLPRPPTPAPLPASSGAAGPLPAILQLLGALGSPTVQDALMAMLLGRAGTPTVQTATGSPVNVPAVANLLGMLAGHASAEWEQISAPVAIEGYGEGLDFAAPEARAAWLFEQLEPVELAPEDLEWREAGGWLDAIYDELDAELVLSEQEEQALDEAAFDESLEPEWSFANG